MKNFKKYIGLIGVFALLFTSCTKEETGINAESEKATLSFGAIVNNLVTNRSATKDHLSDFPECTEDVPYYVEIVLMQGDDDVVGSSTTPYKVQLAEGQLFTEEDPALELEPGTYSLDHFAVYNEDEELIWIAPRMDSNLGAYVDNALPLSIDLGAGVKKYVDVSVLCYDNREVNEYGYLFFELDTHIALTYCFFANYCDEDGMHFPASYSVNIWSGTDSSGTQLYTDTTNSTEQYDNGDYYATPLCFALPDNDDLEEEYIYYEVTLMDWMDAYGSVTPGTMISGTLSKQDIIDNFDGENNVNYEHLRFGCGEDDGNGNGGDCDPQDPADDCDNDGVPNGDDDCPSTPGTIYNGGCPDDEEPTCAYDSECDIENVDFPCLDAYLEGEDDEEAFVFIESITSRELMSPDDLEVLIGNVVFSYNSEDELVITLNPTATFALSGYVIEVIPVEPGTTQMSTSCREIECNASAGATGSETFSNVSQGEAFYCRIKAIICPPVIED